MVGQEQGEMVAAGQLTFLDKLWAKIATRRLLRHSAMRDQMTQPGRCLALLALSLVCATYAAEESRQVTFEAKYRAWRQWRHEHPFASIVNANPPFGDIVALGPCALPFIVQKIEQRQDDVFLERAIRLIAKTQVARSEWPTNALGDSNFSAKWCVQWWKEGRKETGRKFASGYAQYHAMRAQGKKAEAQTEIGRIRSLGIAALPYIMEKMSTDNGDLAKLVSQLTDRAVSPDAKTAECLEWWAKNKEKWLLPDN